MDAESKLIVDYAAMTANEHDIKKYEELIDPARDVRVYGDSAYINADIENRLKEEAMKLERTIEFEIIERAYKNNPLNDLQKAWNKIKSATRCRVEHAFGHIRNSMNGMELRSIGFARASFHIAFTNLVYNMCRYEYLNRVSWVPS